MMKYLKLFTNFGGAISSLKDDEVGRLFRAMLQYAEDETEPDLPGNERHVWGSAKLHMDMARTYSERKSQAGQIGGQASTSKDKQSEASASNDKQAQATTSNVELKEKKRKEKKEEILSYESTKKPTLEEVEEYVREAELAMDPRAFFDHFTSNGWKVGGKAPMKDWRAAARNWARRERPTTTHTPSAYKNADLEKLEINLEEIGL